MALERRQFSMDVKVGESVSIDRGRAIVTVMEKSGQRARLAFNADKKIPINKMKKVNAAEYAKKGIPSQ